MYLFLTLLQILAVIIPVLIAVAYFTLAERKGLGAIQRRRGPNVIGTVGLLQPISDGLKLFFKETIIPITANKKLFIFGPILTFGMSLLGWAVIPFGKNILLSDINLGILYILAVSSLGVYGLIISGWSSNSKYALLGALRSTAQMVSYEVSLGFILLSLMTCTGSGNITNIITSQVDTWYIVPFSPLFLMLLISGLAETNRHPFDLPEAEAELVSGYNVEYSAMGFALFSLGEYSNILLMCYLIVIFFFGGWLSPFTGDSVHVFSNWIHVKALFFIFIFIWVRAALPRYRYDQLMSIGWKFMLPASLGYLVFISCLLKTFHMLPF